MFTGIITAQGKLQSAEILEQSARLVIATPEGFLNHTKLGDSIAVNGVCLTVVGFNNADISCFTVDLSKETLDKTNFINLCNNAINSNLNNIVNLEHSLKIGDTLDGHIVQGHIDNTVTIEKITIVKAGLENNTENKIFLFKIKDVNILKYIAPKGSVTINGISLTVNKVFSDSFTVNIIPHTLAMTNLKYMKVGDDLNLEVDMFARYCVNFLEQKFGDKDIGELWKQQ